MYIRCLRLRVVPQTYPLIVYTHLLSHLSHTPQHLQSEYFYFGFSPYIEGERERTEDGVQYGVQAPAHAI